MKSLETLRENICMELDEISGQGRLGGSDLERVHILTDTLKNIDKIEMLEEGGEYSNTYGGGRSYGGGSYRNDRPMDDDSMGDGYSRGYVRGYYRRGRR